VINYNLLSHPKYKKSVLEKMGVNANISHTNISQFMESLRQSHLSYNLYVALTNRRSTLF